MFLCILCLSSVQRTTDSGQAGPVGKRNPGRGTPHTMMHPCSRLQDLLSLISLETAEKLETVIVPPPSKSVQSDALAPVKVYYTIYVGLFLLT